MRNFIAPGDLVEMIAPAGGVKSGEGYIFGTLFGIADHTVGEGRPVPIAVEGIYRLNKATGTGMTQGQKVYWNDDAKQVTVTATGNIFIGHSIENALADTLTVAVRLSI